MRTPEQVGQLLRERREELGLTQEEVDGVSAAWLRKVERGTAADTRSAKRFALMRALGWPADGFERLTAGDDPRTFEQPAEAPPPDVADRLDRIESLVFRILERLDEQLDDPADEPSPPASPRSDPGGE